MAVLYDIALVIGGEVSVQPLLVKTLQRLLYHTSFPAGLVFLGLPPDDGVPTVEVRLDAAVGDFGFAEMVGKPLTMPAALLHGVAEVAEAPEWLQALPGASRPYRVYLRLPIDHQGVVLLISPHFPGTQLPLAHVFQPVMANLAKAILLCRHNDIYAAGLVSERNTARQSLAESEEKFRSINAAAQDAIMLIDDEDRIVYWNPAAERLFGFTDSEALGAEVHRLIVPQRYYERFVQGFSHFRGSGKGPIIGKTIEVEALRKDGSEFPVELSIDSLQLKGHWHAVGILRDITERHESEVALLLAHRALRTLSGCNSILVRATDEQRLLEDICHLIVDTGGYHAAWVAYPSDDQSRLRPLASAGVDQAYLDALRLGLEPGAQDSGPAVDAFFSHQPQIVQDIASDSIHPANRAAALQRGMASAIALPLVQNGDALGVLMVYADEPEAFNAEELGLLREMAEDLAFGIATLRSREIRQRLEGAEHEQAERLQRALLGTIQAVALTVEMRDPYTAGHQLRVSQLAVAIANELGWSVEQIEGVRLGAMILDIGKIYVPAEILNRPGKLSEMEFEIIKHHPQIGYDIVKDVEFPWPVAQIILQHHERLDGSGYPNGLVAEQIIPEARVLAVADVVEAIASHRPYRPSYGVEAGLQEVIDHRGTLYDTTVVDACVRLFRERGFSFD